MQNGYLCSSMKKILMKKALLFLLFLLPIACLGQNIEVLKFLGIPIDGTESQFAAKLKGKGFTYNSYTEGYKGQFNGKPVDVYIHTNHNLVDRVYVAFPYTTEEGIRVEFNRLLGQFQENAKYIDLSMNSEIPADDDISYEISVKNKRYQASFSYFSPDRDPVSLMDAIFDKLSNYLTEEQQAKLKEYTKKLVDTPKEEQERLKAQMMAEMQEMGLGQTEDAEMDPEKALDFLAAFMDGMRSLADGDVWFMIHEQYGRYNIGLYYDNLHNQAHGEDL
jgi:hypothetical protein